MLDHAIATLETAVACPEWRRQSVDIWEALRTVRAAGAGGEGVSWFWRQCGRPIGTIGAEHMGGYQVLTGALNRICRDLGRERSYDRLDDVG